MFEVVLHIQLGNRFHVGESVYLMGSINQWKGNGLLLGIIADGQLEMVVNLKDVPAGDLEFRLTRGGWQTVNCTKDGKITEPFHFSIDSDQNISIEVEAWRDNFPASTATEQVQVLSDNFYFPTLNAYRKVWIYLPKSYEMNAAQRFPVLYMHDGQHLFDEAAAVGRKGPVEWQVDKVINQSADDAIVVAIAHGGAEKDRLKDYVVHPVEGMASPQGKAYLQDIVHVLKPFVDNHYRTLSAPQFNAMAGSSLGGLLSLYAGLYYPDVFHSYGVFSPSLWLDAGSVAEEVVSVARQTTTNKASFYFYGGGLENRKIKDRATVEMDKDIEALVKLMRTLMDINIAIDINPIGKHGALYWQQAFPAFFEWWQEQMK